MKNRNFLELMKAQWSRGNFVCVGLDSEYQKIPPAAKRRTICETIIAFNEAIISATKDLVCAYKPNIAFYEAHGNAGLIALRETIKYILDVAPEVPVILDAKRADIGNTNTGYVQEAFTFLQADAITVSPYLGAEALQSFLAEADKGIFVLCRTSNPGAGEFQDLLVRRTDHLSHLHLEDEQPIPLYQDVARRVAHRWNEKGNCALVVGATYPDELHAVRKIVGDMPILIPGIGEQGGDIRQTVSAGKDSRGQGMIINSSRGIIFASEGVDFAEVARRETKKLHELVNIYR